MLLEDDPAFRKILADCLAENGYTVVAVQNSREGLKEVLTRDFAMVLYDPMMAGLPGDLFYNAVNKIDRDLCERFVFMTSDRNDASTTGFITNIDGAVLRKPFGVESLLDLIAFARARGTFERMPKDSPDDRVLSTVCEPADESPACGNFRPAASTVAEGVAQVVAPGHAISTVSPHQRGMPDDSLPQAPIQSARSSPKGIEYRVPPMAPLKSHQAVAVRARSSDVSPTRETEVRPGRVSRALLFGEITILIVLVAGLWKPYWEGRDRIAAAFAKRLTLEVEWTALSRDLREALAARSKIETAQRQLAGLSTDRGKPRWSSALRCVVPAASARVEILEVDARGGNEDSGACELRVRGAADGPQARVVADRFRQAVEGNLNGIAKGRPVRTRFERLEDTPGALPDQERADFVMIATLGLMDPPAATGKENR